MTAQLVTDALMMALWRRGTPQELLHHSDQGSQYTSEQFQRLLAEQGITCSMSRSGDVWDNSAMESFFSSSEDRTSASQGVSALASKPRRTCSTTSSGSTIRTVGTRRSAYLSPVEYEKTAESA